MNTHVLVTPVSSAELTLIPNERTPINPQIETYVNRYQTFLKKTAEAVLGLAQTLLEAQSALNGVDFHIFCEEVGTPEGSPTYSKLLKIAENASRFKPFMDRLPNTWTTIYKLAKLTPEKFERVSADLTPFITAREINELVGEEKEERHSQHYDVRLSFEDMTPEQKMTIYEELDRLKSEYSFKVQETLDFKKELTSFKTSIKV